MRELGKQTQLLLASLVLVLASVTIGFRSDNASAAQITNRSLTLVAGAGGNGGSLASGNVKHEFKFTIPTAASVGSIKFEYCTIASGTCTPPPGVGTGSASLDFESGVTGWSVNSRTPAAPYLYKATAGAVSANTVATLRLANVINPSANNTTFHVRISTYASTDTSGTPIDTGTVTASTSEAIVITGVMPESLIFCTGATVTANCATTTAGTIAFNQLFSPTDTATAKSEMAASTNAGGGYAITVNGTTLTSGSNTIPAMATATTGVRGTGQFGMNLRLNTVATSTAPIGADVTPASDGVNLKANPNVGYSTVDTFKFVPGDVVANSAFDGTSNTTIGPTNSQVYTASYIVNVAGNQLAGTYTTTLTYVCTPTF